MEHGEARRGCGELCTMRYELCVMSYALFFHHRDTEGIDCSRRSPLSPHRQGGHIDNQGTMIRGAHVYLNAKKWRALRV
jgi:hypothetical protein